MELMIESTDMLTEINGSPARVWEGHTAKGVRCLVFVHRIVVADSLDLEGWAALRAQLAPAKLTPLAEVLREREERMTELIQDS